MNVAEQTAKTGTGIVSKLARLGRFILFICTAGWAFPHVCTEELDLTRIQKGYMKDAQ